MFHTSYFSPTLTLLAEFSSSTCASASLAADGHGSSSSPGTTGSTSNFFRTSLANSVITAHLEETSVKTDWVAPGSEIQFKHPHSHTGGLHLESSELWRPLQTMVSTAVTPTVNPGGNRNTTSCPALIQGQSSRVSLGRHWVTAGGGSSRP